MVKIQNICRGSYKKSLLDIFSTSCDQPTNNQLTNELKNIGRRFSIGRPKNLPPRYSIFSGDHGLLVFFVFCVFFSSFHHLTSIFNGLLYATFIIFMSILFLTCLYIHVSDRFVIALYIFCLFYTVLLQYYTIWIRLIFTKIHYWICRLNSKICKKITGIVMRNIYIYSTFMDP